MKVPGAESARLAARLKARESRNVTYLAEDFPIFWESARGAHVTDVDGNTYVDCTAAFGVANAGHANPRVAAAVAEQAERLLHGLGDVHPTAIRVELLERLASILHPELSRAFLATTGSEAVEAALKTAMLATGGSRFAAYRGGYHGLSLGALAVCGIDRFREPFAAAVGAEPLLLDYPRAGESANRAASAARETLARNRGIAALVVEPIQGRGGCIVPPAGYLSEVRAICDELGIVMIVDEIFTGFGRTGNWFAIDHEQFVPDILCIGKAMGSGVPVSATIGRSRVMDAWPSSSGEALHTSTFLGNPLGCAAALATLEEFERFDLPGRARRLGNELGPRLGALRSHEAVVAVRGRGLFWGVELRNASTAFSVVKRSLEAGVIFVQSGTDGATIAIHPPLVIEELQLRHAIDVLDRAIEEES